MTSSEISRIKRWFAVAAVAFAVLAGFVWTFHWFDAKFHRITGPAEFIWVQHRLASGQPVVFFATRDFSLPDRRDYVHVEVLGDPEYTLWFNGEIVGGNRTSAYKKYRFDVYDVTSRAHSKRNRIVVAVRSADGVGGLLVSVDTGPMGENRVVTDRQWHLYREWTEALPRHDPESIAAEAPVVIGRPPVGRWNFPERKSAEPYPPDEALLPPSRVIEFEAALPRIEIVSGVAVAGVEKVHARAFDFGPVTARARLQLPAPFREAAPAPPHRKKRSYASIFENALSRLYRHHVTRHLELPGASMGVIRIRYANHEVELRRQGEIESLVIAEGEQTVVDPERRSFRYLIVYDSAVSASVLVPQETIRKAPSEGSSRED
ncbi:MAG: hypothetical protein WBX15_20740 [Thermoanaerobaculia bacterium]